MHLYGGPTEPEEGVIMKLFNFYNCNKEVEGTWWLMSGPDIRGNCLVSWTFLQPHKASASLGWT
jgi:hypothetical protein